MGDITYSVVNVTGKLCLLSYGRIKKEDLDPTLLKYDIQSTDDGFEPSAIKKFVLVNHWVRLSQKTHWSLMSMVGSFLIIMILFILVMSISVSLNS